MRKRGPKSAAEISTPSLPDPRLIETVPRPDAPYDLTDEQAKEWWAIVDRLPADWFGRESHALLSQYCRHAVAARHVAMLITQAEASKRLNLERFDRLLRLQERESRCLAMLGTKMRITHQSTARHETTHRPDTIDAPWEYGR